jgi:histidinol-phosphate/aromatic aminotransferase/cobyric acid decarboxylase-like protein
VHTDEHERFSARLANIPGVELIPSFGAWVLLKVEDPAAFARRIEKRVPGAGLTVPAQPDGVVRIPVRNAKSNDLVHEAVREHFAALAAVDRHLDPS